MISSGDNKRNQTCFLCLEEKTQREKWLIRWSFEKISSGQSSQLSLEASASGFKLGCLENLDLENKDLRPKTSKTKTSKTETPFEMQKYKV